MKTLTQLGMLDKAKRYLAAPIISFSILGLSACGSSGDGDKDVAGEPGVIDGTGDKLSGTAAIGKPIANTDVVVRLKDGSKQTAKTNASGEFDFNSVKGEGPYLLRVKNGEGFLYSIAYDPDTKARNNITVNIHPYTDLIIRNWFAEQDIDLEALFNSNTGKLPEPADTSDIEKEIKAILKNLFPDFNVPSNFGLFDTAFVANSQGFDLLLDQSSVVINQTITVTVVNITNNVQTTLINNIPVDTDLTSETDDAPTLPGNVNASAASATEILITWTPASDDKGISAYNVYRNGNKVAVTPYTLYKDVGLTTGESYSYTIEAIDSKGQSSGQTTATPAVIPTAVDTTPPEAPSNTTTAQENNAVTVSWMQANPADVAKYEILRKQGQSGAQTSLGFSTTSSFVDSNVQAGTEYCYSVRANDAADNASPMSNESCITVSGDPVTAVDCTNPIEVTENITTDTTWNGCYLVTRGLNVANVSTLTVEPGSIIQFQEGTYLEVARDSILKSVGTQENPITYTGQLKTNGYWTGIELKGLSDQNEIRYSIVEYGGSSSFSEANIYVGSDAKATITNTIMRHSSTHGLRLANDIGAVEFISNTLTENDLEPASIHANNLSILDALSSYSGNTIDSIKVLDNNITKDQTWSNLDVPYYLPSGRVDLQSTLTIAPGTKLYFANDGNFDIESSGTLIAKGTESEPILFSGQQQTAGYWHGLQFTNNQNSNELDYAIVEYAGGGTGNGKAAVNVFGQDGRLKMHNTIIRHSNQYGLDLNKNAVTDFANNTYTNNTDGAAIVYFNDIGDLEPSSTYTGNTKDIVTVRDHTVTDDQTVHNIGIAYDFPETGYHDVNAKLTVNPGVVMQFGPGTTISVERLGSLTAIGTADNRVTFTGKEKSAGYWGGIQFTNSSSADNKLDYTIVEYAGDTGNTKGLVGVFGQDARVDVTNSMLRNSSHNGIWYNDSTGGTQANNTFSDITGQNVFVKNP